MPTKAAVILKKVKCNKRIRDIFLWAETKCSYFLKYLQFKEGVDTKNAYILFSTLEDAEKALQANGKLFMEKHLRVDKANEKIVTKLILRKNKKRAYIYVNYLVFYWMKQLDYTRTAFIGNLPFSVSEE